MKEINLREYYPFYTQDVIVEVPDEVADLLRELKLADAASFLRTYRHKAYFSLDYDVNVERDALVVVLTPADILAVSYTHLSSWNFPSSGDGRNDRPAAGADPLRACSDPKAGNRLMRQL